MNKHKRDSDALLEAFQQIQLQEKKKEQEEKDEKKDSDGKYSDHDGKKERCDYVPCEEETHETPYGGNPEGEDEKDEEVQEEMDMSPVIETEPGMENITDAISNLTGDEFDDGDWEGAIKQVMSGLAERVIHHAKEGDGGVVGDPDLADRWDFKTGLKDAVEDLLDPQTYGDLSSGFKKAFHRAKQDEESGRFDNSPESLLKNLKSNYPELGEKGHDDEPIYYPRERDSMDGPRGLGL